MPDSSTRSKWLSSPRLILITFVLCVLGIAIAAYPSVRFFKLMFEDTIFPIAKFDANTETVIDLPDADTRYIIAVAVNESRAPAPPVELTLTDGNTELKSVDYDGWVSMMGHHYRILRLFAPTESAQLTVTAQAEPGEDFIVYRYHADTAQRRLAETVPWWIGGGIPFFGGVALVFFVILRKAFKKDELRLEL